MDFLIGFLKVVFILFGVIMVGFILLRRPEQSGLSGAFGGPTTDAVFGVRAAKTLDKLIAVLAAVFLGIGILLHTSLLKPSGLDQFKGKDKGKAGEKDKTKPADKAKPAAPKGKEPAKGKDPGKK